MFGKEKIRNSNVRKSTNPKFFCLEKPKSSIPIVGKAQILNTNVGKSQNPQFQTLQKTNSRIPKFENAKIKTFTNYKPKT